MRNERRYTEGQKILLKFDQEKLNDDERELLRRVLLPRTKYLPQTAEEGEALALQMLRREKYERMLSLIGKIEACYGRTECRWTRGDHLWDLYYSVRSGKDVLCRFGICLDVFNIILSFGQRECEQFERERDTFPRGMIQWTYDMAVFSNGRKNLMFDTADERILPYIFRLLAYKKKPNIPFSEIE